MTTPSATPYVYKKSATKRKTAYIVASILLAIAILPTFLDDNPRVFPDIIVYGLVWGLPFIIWLITLWSINRYGNVTITDTTFRVGRHKVNIADIDQLALLQVNPEDPSFLERMATSAGNVDIPIVLEAEKLGNPPVFGGAYGVPMATDSFIMQMKDGRSFTVPLPRGSRQEILEHLLKGSSQVS